MRIAGSIVVVVVAAAAPLVASPRTPGARTDTLAVQVNLAFDRSITSSTIKTIARGSGGDLDDVWRRAAWSDPGARRP